MKVQQFTSEIISTFGVEVMEQIIENAFATNTQISKMCKLSVSSSDVLTSLFAWNNTPQGFDYWSNIFTTLEK